MVSSGSNKVASLRTNLGIEGQPDIDVAFYYDVFHLAVQAVSKMKDEGSWPAAGTMEYKKCNEYTQTDPITRNLNLLQSLKTVSVSVNTDDFFSPILILY